MKPVLVIAGTLALAACGGSDREYAEWRAYMQSCKASVAGYAEMTPDLQDQVRLHCDHAYKAKRSL